MTRWKPSDKTCLMIKQVFCPKIQWCILQILDIVCKFPTKTCKIRESSSLNLEIWPKYVVLRPLKNPDNTSTSTHIVSHVCTTNANPLIWFVHLQILNVPSPLLPFLSIWAWHVTIHAVILSLPSMNFVWAGPWVKTYSVLQSDSCIIRERHVECAVDARNEGVRRRWHNLDLVAIIMHLSFEEVLAPILHTFTPKINDWIMTASFQIWASYDSQHKGAEKTSWGLSFDVTLQHCLWHECLDAKFISVIYGRMVFTTILFSC